ncbi:MAG: septum formation initiator family protein [Alkalispirochaetaceae bacterium]
MKLSIPLLTGFATYLLLTLLFGEYGVVNYQNLQAEERRMEAHLSRLSERRKELLVEEAQLRESDERIRVEAHSLGLLTPGERLLRIGGTGAPEGRNWVAGSVVTAERRLPNHTDTIRAIAVCAALLALILTLSSPGASRRRERKRPSPEEESYSIRRASM